MTKKIVKTFKDLPLLIIYTTGCIFSAILYSSYVQLNLILEQMISVCASILFIFLAIKNADFLVIDRTGITVWRLIGKKKIISWADIKEVGVIGTKIFPKTEKNNGGRKYIYFSEKILTENDRFELALKWPPKIVYTCYTKNKLDFIKRLSGKETVSYNIGKTP